jgi:gliding motility-associated lipoprotein GldH
MYVNAPINMRRQVLIASIVITVSLLFASCNRGVVYHEYASIDEAGWHQDSVCHFEMLIDDSLSVNDFFINIRNNTDYPYSNLYLFVTTEFPNGHTTRDTIECILAGKDGRWLGSGSGRIKENKIMLQKALRFPLRGVYDIYLEQAMREEILQGIEDIGFSVEISENQ